MNTVETCCYNCGSSHNAFYAFENGFSLVKCSGCGLLYVTPRPCDEELIKAHECGVHQGESELDVTGTFDNTRILPYCKILKNIYGNELKKRKRTWLDIGCGHGEFLAALQQYSNHQVIAKGMEPNKNKQKSAVEHGLDVNYFELEHHKGRYDVISLLNVYSHLPNPPEFLLLCKQLINPDGELLLETGDTANFSPEEHYKPFYLPDHLSFASEEIVSSILQRCGFKIVSVHKYPVFPFKCSFLRWSKEVVKCIWPGKQSCLGELFRQYKMSYKYITDTYIRARLY